MKYLNMGISDITGLERKCPIVEYNPKRKRTKTVEKRIQSYLRRNIAFVLKTSILTSEDTWMVDSGGWVYQHESETLQDRGQLLGHIKNCLPFFDGPQPIWVEKRSYQRRSVKRGRLA